MLTIWREGCNEEDQRPQFLPGKLKGQRKLKGPTRRVLNLALKFVLESKKNIKGILMKAKAGGFRDQ